MILRRLYPTALACAAVALATTSPTLAQDGPHADVRPPFPDQARAAPGMMPPPERDAWLDECQDRMAMGERGKRARRRAHERCVAYLDDYYAYYRNARPAAPYAPGAYSYGQGYGAPYGHGYGMQGPASPCCQPPASAKPRCKEVIEYEYVDVPVRHRRHHRPAPDKRIKVVPDKRVRVK